MSDELVLTGARIVTSEAVIDGSVHISDGVIRDVSPGRSAAAGAVDLEGDILIPGLIDLHTDNLEKHYMPRPGVCWNGMSAAISHDAQVISAGVTTVFDSICVGVHLRNPDRNAALMPMIEGVRAAKARNLLRAEHLLHLRCEVTDRDVVGLFEPLADDPLVRLMSVMDHAPGHRQSPDIARYRTRQARLMGLPAETVDVFIEELLEASRTVGPRNRAALIAIGQARGIPVASHDDETPAHVTEAAEAGISICEFPTTFAAAETARACGMSILMGGPNVMRGGSHSGNVAAAELARHDLLDILSSDYVPISLLQAAFALTRGPDGFALGHAIGTVTAKPAKAAGLDDRGEIAPAKRADLVRVGLIDDLPVVRSVWRDGRIVF